MRLLQRASHMQVKCEEASALLHGWTERSQQVQVDHRHLDLHVECLCGLQPHSAMHLEEWTPLDLPVHVCLYSRTAETDGGLNVAELSLLPLYGSQREPALSLRLLPGASKSQLQVQAPVWHSKIRGEGLHRGPQLKLLYPHLALHRPPWIKRALQVDRLRPVAQVETLNLEETFRAVHDLDGCGIFPYQILML